MSSAVQSAFRRLAAETRGAEIAEAAAVLPLMFMFLLGIFWFGQAFSIYGAITRAAQEGARAGSIPYCATCVAGTSPLMNAANAVQAAMVSSKLNPALARYPSTPPVFNSCVTGNPLGCASGGSPNLCVQAPVEFFTPPSGTSGVCGISVSFQYPFQFWLPFTSLNKQQIWIAAAARVRLETY
jgi:hypothetical protein